MRGLATRPRARSRPHWYRLYFGECPVCGKNKSYRERVYGRRPKSLRKRIVYLTDFETYDHCIG